MPGVLIGKTREPRGLKPGTILLEAIARERDLAGIRASRPRLDGDGHLHDGLHLKQAHGTVLVHLVQPGIDLAAHGVTHDAHKAANTGRPRAPGNSVERGGAVERASQAARQALGRGDANAHARERARATPHEHRVDVIHRKPRARQDIQARGHELLVGVPTAQVVATRQKLDTRLAHATNGAGKHVRRRVNGQDNLLGSGFAHGLGPFTWCE